MIRILALAALAAASLTALVALAPANPPAVTTLHFTIERGYVVVQLPVNGKIQPMVLDTGSPFLALPHIASHTEQVRARGEDGKFISAWRGDAIVNLAGQHFGVSSVELPWCQQTGFGLLGQSVLSQFHRVTIDYSQHTVTFE